MELKGHCLILVTGAFFSTGGIASVNRNVIECISERYYIDLLSLNESQNKKVINIGKKSISAYLCFNRNKVKFIFEIWKMVLSKKYELIICDHINLAASLAPLALIKLVEYVVWLHGVEVLKPNPSLEGLLGLKFSKKCLANSNYTFLTVNQRYPTINIKLCELSLEKNWHINTDPILQSMNHKEIFLMSIDGKIRLLKGPIILMVGRMDCSNQYKGHELLIKSLPSVVEKHPDTQMILAGCGSDYDRLHQLSSKLPVSIHSNLFLPGYVSSGLLSYLYQKCYLFILPSSIEGFGLVYLEAMSRVKPCIGVKAAATPYLIRDGVNGFLLENPPQMSEIIEKITYLLDHQELAMNMGKIGFDMVQENYLFPHFKERLWQALES